MGDGGERIAPGDYQIPEEFTFIYTQIAPLFSKIQSLMVEFLDAELQLQFLIENIHPYEERLANLVKAMRSKDEDVPLEQTIRLFGIQPTHDLLIGLKFYQAIHNEELSWEETGKPSIKIEDLIPFALKSREEFGEDSRNRLKNFLAGMVFDALKILNEKVGVNAKGAEELIQAQFDSALKVGKAGLAAGKSADALKLDEFLVALTLLKRTGRLVFSITRSDYLEFSKAVEGNEYRSSFAHLGELKKYGISNNMVSSLLCKFVPGFEKISPALNFYDYPYMLDDKMVGEDVFQLVTLCSSLTPKSGDSKADGA